VAERLKSDWLTVVGNDPAGPLDYNASRQWLLPQRSNWLNYVRQKSQPAQEEGCGTLHKLWMKVFPCPYGCLQYFMRWRHKSRSYPWIIRSPLMPCTGVNLSICFERSGSQPSEPKLRVSRYCDRFGQRRLRNTRYRQAQKIDTYVALVFCKYHLGSGCNRIYHSVAYFNRDESNGNACHVCPLLVSVRLLGLGNDAAIVVLLLV
jgi:hypothetical protein